MKKIFKRPLIVIIPILLLLAGCFHLTQKPSEKTFSVEPEKKVEQTKQSLQEPPSSVKVKEISLESGNLYFKPSELRLKVNEPVKINIQNKGGHTFTIDELAINMPLQDAAATVTFTPTKPGTFQYYCATPGHKQAGMVGKLIVE